MILAEDSYLVLNVTFEGVSAGAWLLILFTCCRRLLREGSKIKLGDQLEDSPAEQLVVSVLHIVVN